MHCNGLTIPGGDSRFFFPSNPSTAGVATARNPNSTVLFPTRIGFPTRIRAAPTKPRAACSDVAVVAEAAEMSFYELLGIPASGSIGEIKQAYKQLARKYHPDVSPPDRVEEYTQRFIRVQEAYETLSDPRRRAMYDQDMARGLAFTARRRYQTDEVILFTPQNPILGVSDYVLLWFLLHFVDFFDEFDSVGFGFGFGKPMKNSAEQFCRRKLMNFLGVLFISFIFVLK